MLNSVQLEAMKNIDITQVDRNTLIDVSNICIDSSLPAPQKMQAFLKQAKNPYCFRCCDTPVRIRFVSESKTLAQSLNAYFISLK